ncbi:MAG: GTPase HflX [Treponemataceae bacterium]|nr:GTPase HflX [Treponemataceae bacterium]
MIEIYQEENTPVKAFLVGIQDNKIKTSSCLTELKGLVKTLKMEVGGEIVITRVEPNPQYFLGTGKVQEILEQVEETESECIIFDFEISPTHQRNWEKLANIPCFDRQEVILRIFESRAATREATLQVELASLEYFLPRLAHSYGDMARQRGGAFGSKGSGETKLELDRRKIQEKIYSIKKELDKVRKNRQTQRKQREKIPLPVCALVGYTNAGKSSLLNVLTCSDVYEKDELFATLDTSTRRLSKDGKFSILMTDTVGFIKNLPHNLIDAFRSTLEEAVISDVLVIVLDSSSDDVLENYQTTVNVLEEIGADKNKRLIVLNKWDLADSFQKMKLQEHFNNAICTSTKTKEGLDDLVNRIFEICMENQIQCFVPYENGKIISLIKRECFIISETNKDDGIVFTVKTNPEVENLLKDFLI